MQLMARIFLLVSLVVGLQTIVYSQAVAKGTVKDEAGKQPLGFVTVRLFMVTDAGSIKEQATDSAGNFQFYPMPYGQYRLELSSVGYRTLHKEIFLNKPVVQLDDILLSTASGSLNEVVVTGGKAAYRQEAGKLVLNVSGNKLFKTSANALDVFRKIPGLVVNGDGTLLLSGRIAPTVYIDGKPTPMSAEELQNYLSHLSPEQIASIEVNSNPSAQYDAEHKAIIDIKLKRDQTLGWQGTLSTHVQQNAYTLADNNLLLTYKTKKLTYTGRLGYTAGSSIYQYRALQHQASTNIMTTRTRQSTANNNAHVQLGLDYAINKDQRLELLLRAYEVNRAAHAYNTLYTTDSSAKRVVAKAQTDNYNNPEQDNYAINLNYIRPIGKIQLQWLNAFVSIRNRQVEDIQSFNSLTGNRAYYWKTRLKNKVLIRTTQADLAGNALKGKWNAGMRFSFVSTRNDLRYDTLNNSNVFILDSSRTNRFHYNEYIMAGYVTYQKAINKFNLQAGLRAEHTRSIADAITTKQANTRNYITWLPSLSITYPVRDNRQWQLAFSRRITRPNFQQLNPFRFYLSPLNYVVGNPNLQPATTSMLNLSYSQPSFITTLKLGREVDPMARYPMYDPVTNILEYLGRNLPYNDFASVEITVPVAVTKWWRMSHTVAGYYKKELTPYYNVVYKIPVYEYMVNGSQVINLPKGFVFDMYYYYASRGGNGLYKYKAVRYLDLGLQKTWLKGKLNSKFNYYDVFNNFEIYYIFREKSILNNELAHWFGNNRLSLKLSYAFGKSTHRAKQSGKHEEENRAGL